MQNAHTYVTSPSAALKIMLCGMANLEPTPSRHIITAQTMDEAKAAAYANDPQTELVILGVSENPAVTTCGWARRFFESSPSGF